MFDVMDLIKRCISRSQDQTVNEYLQLAYNRSEEIFKIKLAEKEQIANKKEKITSIDKKMFSVSDYSILELLMSNEWPEATPSFLICDDTEEDKQERAEGILDYVESNVVGKKVLDFGCGEGHVSQYAAKNAVKSIGYDIIKSGNLNWENESEFLLTTDLNKVIANAPYDLVILYDVLDHAKSPIDVLNTVKTLCNSSTKIFIRNHSFMSRHGGHIYRQLNKAWLHLYFNDDELLRMGIKKDIDQIIYEPIFTYREWINSAKLQIVSEDTITTIIEDFFKSPQLTARLPEYFKDKSAEEHMNLIFCDFIVSI